MSISAVDPGGVPGFAQGLERSIDVLVTLGQLIVYLVAAVIPFFWIPLGIWWWLRRSSQKTAQSSDDATQSADETPEPVDATVGSDED
jgi:hypothetical protein